MKLSLICLFKKEPIKFKTFQKKDINNQKKVLDIINHNIDALQKAINFCDKNDIASYRISSDLFPHFDKLENQEYLISLLSKIDTKNVILSMHPGQHVNMGSPNEEVVKNSITDIKYHLMIAKQLNFNEVNIHIGGTYGNKDEAKQRFIRNMKDNFSREDLDKITIENDELSYSIEDVIEIANILNIKAVYDIHHERCFHLNEKINEEELFLKARETWGDNIQRIHLSSPRDGYISKIKARPHHDFIKKEDFPLWLMKYDVIIDIEAKAKEEAIRKLKEELNI